MAELIPETRKYIEGFKPIVESQTLGHEVVRKLFNSASHDKGSLVQLAKIEDRHIAVDKETRIKIRIYTPDEKGTLPIYIYYHGGGWVLGDIETSDATCRMIAEQTKHIVVSVDYRLSPEYKFPIPIHDCYAAFKWVSENAANFNGNPSNIVVSGDSAGGNMATVVAMMARDQKGPAISAQVLIYPVTSFNTETDSFKEFETGYGLTKELAIWFLNHYIRDEKDKADKYAAPLLAGDLSALPPALVIVAENDVLRDNGLAYAESLKKAKVQVESLCAKGLVHGYFVNPKIFQEQVKETIAVISGFLQTVTESVILNAGRS